MTLAKGLEGKEALQAAYRSLWPLPAPLQHRRTSRSTRGACWLGFSLADTPCFAEANGWCDACNGNGTAAPGHH